MKSNKKRILFVLAILTMALVLSCALVACNKTDTPDAPKKEFTITFDTQGGSEVKPLVLKEGETITLPSNPTKDGSVFDGWYLDSSYTQAFDSTKRIDSNMVLYAKWTILDDGKSIIASDYFDINGLVLTMNKKNYITSTEDVFDLQNKFSTSTGSGWRAFTSPNCDQPTEITTRMANVSAGWNNIYVKVENLTTYENQIYQLKIYRYPTIVYRELDDGFLEIQSVSDCGDVLFPDDKIDNITSIGDSAFSSCPSLRTLQNLPKLTNIGTSAFANCKRLTSTTIPDSVTSIGNYAFEGCTGLTSVTLGNSVKSIGESAFEGCTGLTSIYYTSGLAGWCGINVYGKIVSDTRALYIGGKKVEGDLIIPDNVKSIGYGAFNGFSGLTSITIGNSVTSIGDRAFLNCTGLTSVTIGNNVTSIGDSAFSDCTGLTSIIIPNSVTSIGRSAFSGCSGLTSVTIGNSVTSIGNSAFDNTAWYNNQPNGLVYAGKVAYKYKGTMPSNTSIVLKEGTLSIGLSAFVDCTGLTSITIPDSVTNIGGSAFQGCTGLTSITIPDSVTSIGNSAFYNCSALTSITIPDSVTSIGDGAFLGCTGLTSATIGNSVTGIGNSAFSDCTGLTSITIPNSVTSIGDGAFLGCTGLTSVTIPDSVTSIGGGAFYGCTGLTSITIPDSVTSIGYIAFYGCTGLTSITVAKGNTKYHSAENCLIETESKILIAGCKNSIIPTDGSVTRIGDYAFFGCTGLMSVTIGNSVTSIGLLAFFGCTGLTSIMFNGTMEEWNAISKGTDWKYNVPSECEVVCTDGTVSI